MVHLSEKVTAQLTFEEIYKMDTPAISTMNYGEKNTDNGKKVFEALIFNIVKYYGAAWDISQVRDCAKNCFQEWHYLSFAELSHFAKKVKTGAFGKIFGQFTPAVFIEWLRAYADETDILRGEYFGKHKTVTNWTEPINPVSDERIKELADGLEQVFLSEQEAERAHIDSLISKTKKDIENYTKNKLEQNGTQQ